LGILFYHENTYFLFFLKLGCATFWAFFCTNSYGHTVPNPTAKLLSVTDLLFKSRTRLHRLRPCQKPSQKSWPSFHVCKSIANSCSKIAKNNLIRFLFPVLRQSRQTILCQEWITEKKHFVSFNVNKYFSELCWLYRFILC
jgi:hypothetical protein